MKSINLLGMPLDEYVVMHLREIAAALLLVVVLLCSLLFVELPGATTLTGRVTSQGKPVVFGTVTVITSDHRTHSVPIKPDGTYVLKGVPRGPVKVAVSSPNPQPVFERQAVETGAVGSDTRSQSARPKSASGGPMPGQPAARPGQAKAVEGVSIAATNDRGPAPPNPGRSDAADRGWFRIPGRYANPASSGIGTDVGRGRTTLNLSLD
ncbi:MAG: carboxypeptidase-like regulatory domain-containing protein [Planctomycetia bacterium]|nr:carboxypeptidase-like regulatory domain-containing protein [Planctomycetia bacterium]